MKIENAAMPELAKQIAGTEKKEKEVSHAGDSEAFYIDKTARASGIFKDAVYNKPKQDAKEVMEDIANEAQTKDAEMMRNEMLFTTQTTTGKDIEKMNEDGFSLPDTKVETVVTETDKIKMQLAKAGVDISIFGDGLTDEQLEEMAGSEALAMQLAQTLKSADLPDTAENVKEAQEAAGMAGELTTPSEGAVKYMLDNQLAPTVENLYKAEYSGSSSYQQPQTRMDYDALMGQITSVIEEAGMEVNEETLADSKWLIANEIPLTAENLSYMQQLKGLNLPADEELVANAIAEAMAEGRGAKDAMLLEGYSYKDQAQEAVEIVGQTTDEALAWLVENDMELTVSNLRKANQAVSAGGSVNVSLEKELALVTARRQLEETRLAMTAEANYSLLKRGISIDTKPLAELVDALKQQENYYYEQLLTQDGIPATEENVSTYRQTTETVEGLKSVPAYTLGIPEADEAALAELYETGKAMEESFRKAGESYETLMTAPRRDMGDSIQKAFANVDDILKDLGLETSEANQRAVRILAYNSLEITEESVQQMKAQDEEVQRCFKNMTPSVVREMIKEGINPLDMSIEELNQKAVEIKSNLGIGEEERFSKYLWKLDKAGAITEEERNAFLGIYRLITQVEKTDGAAIGALMEQGSAFTMRNLLTQVRSGKHGAMDYEVNDEFTGVDAVANNLSITEQIEMGYQTNCIRDILDTITPEKLSDILAEEGWQDLTPEQLAEKLAEAGAKENAAAEDAALEQEYYKEQAADLERCQKAPQEVYQMLIDCDMPSTVQNVLAAYELISNRNAAFRKFFEENPDEQTTDLQKELAAAKQKILEDFAEAVKTPEEMAKAQKELADTAENVMKTMINDSEHITNMDIRELKMLNTQIALGTAQLKEETYAIPILVGDEVTNVSLKIVRGKEKKGMVDVLFSTESLGQVAARLSVTDGINGYVAAENKETTALFEAHAEEFAQALGGEKPADIRYLTSEKVQLTAGKNGETGAENMVQKESEEYAVQTKTLYHMAESFIRLVKNLEA